MPKLLLIPYITKKCPSLKMHIWLFPNSRQSFNHEIPCSVANLQVVSKTRNISERILSQICFYSLENDINVGIVLRHNAASSWSLLSHPVHSFSFIPHTVCKSPTHRTKVECILIASILQGQQCVVWSVCGGRSGGGSDSHSWFYTY